jgi:hypothetical protein
MPIDEGTLRAYLDQALSPKELAKVNKQLADSPQLQAALERMSQERHDFAPYLAGLAPPPENQSDALQAWQRFQAQGSQSTPANQTTNIKERIGNMANQPFVKRYQAAIGILIVVAIIAIALSFAPVRAMAGNLLKIFRVQTVTIVPVDQEDMEALRNNPNLERLADQLEPQLEVIDEGEAQKVDSLDEAADLAGFQVAQITALPAEVGEPGISVFQQKIVRLQLDKELLEAVFEAAEIEIDLPDSLDEELVIVTHPNTVIQTWYQEGEEILGFVQMPSPSISYPDGLDLDALGVAGLQLLGRSKEEAEKLGATIDWANTMVLPVPNNAKTDIDEVSINGAKGLVFVNSDSEEDKAAIMWTQNGLSYLIKGNYSTDKVVEMAKSVE